MNKFKEKTGYAFTRNNNHIIDEKKVLIYNSIIETANKMIYLLLLLRKMQ